MHVGAFLKSQWFSASVVLLIILTGLNPALSRAIADADWPRSSAIVLIFFLAGLNMPARESLRGLANWRLHLSVQVFCYLAIPLLTWALVRPFTSILPDGLVMGFYLLAILPTTISMCVVLTSLSGGNVSGSLFNAIVGNLAGVIICPALLILLTGTGALQIDIDIPRVMTKMILLTVAPLVMGQFLRVVGRETVAPLQKKSSLLTRFCILFIVYVSLGVVFETFAETDVAPRHLCPLVLLLPVHLALLWVAWWFGKLMRYSRSDRIAFLFCAPQKTLALAFPIIEAIADDRSDLIGLASLPIIVYHAFQLMAGSAVADRLARARSV